MKTYLARQMVSASLAEGGESFSGMIEATRYERVAFYDRLMLAESPETSRVSSATPNLPQLGAVPDERLLRSLQVEVIAPRVVRLRLGERADDGLPLLIAPQPTGLPLAVERHES